VARSRNIKPGFFSNEDLVELDFATRLLFAGLWTVADKAGRLEDRPKKIKMAVFPADDLDIDAMLSALAERKFITRYAVNGVAYIQIANWTKHQNPHHTEKDSVIPPCQDGELTVKEPLEPGESPKQDGGNPADSLIPDSLIPEEEGGQAAPAPAKKAKTPRQPDPECPEDVEPQVWADWLTLRRKKSAPVTATTISEARKEANLARMSLCSFLKVWCLRGSQGLEASWLKPAEKIKFQQEDPQEWWDSQSGVERKAAELGLEKWGGPMKEQWPQYLARVRRAAKQHEEPSLDLSQLAGLAAHQKGQH
jgi:hypothetical protein